MLRFVERIIFLSIIVALLTTNFLTMTNATFHEKLFDLFSSLPIPYSQFLDKSLVHKQRRISSENKKLTQKVAKAKKLRRHQLSFTRKVSKRIANRTVKMVGRNVGSVVSEAIPYFGVGIMLSVTAMDVYDGCATVRDLHELLQTFNVKDVDEELNEVCNIVVPGEETIIRDVERQISEKDVVEADENGSYQKFYDALGGTIYEMLH